MTYDLLTLLDTPEIMETHYRKNPIYFKEALQLALEKSPDHPVLRTWKARLYYKSTPLTTHSMKSIGLLTSLAILAGLWINIPHFTHIDADFFYPRNLGLIPLVPVTLYFAFRNSFRPIQWITVIAIITGITTYINILPGNDESDTLILACLFTPVLLWGIMGYSYTNGQFRHTQHRLQFLAFHGDWALISAVLLAVSAAVGLLTAGLFEMIDYSLELTFLPYVAIGGLASIPLLAAHLNSLYPQLVSQVSPLIARLFTPVVLFILVAYLITIAISGKNPYTDRQSLIIFNAMLIGVLVILLFSVAGSGRLVLPSWQRISLLALATVTVLLNIIALSAIVMRTAEWGFTPNRIAVTGTNLVILIHLIWVAIALLNTIRRPMPAEYLHKAITRYLPIYLIWAALMALAMPVIFGYI